MDVRVLDIGTELECSRIYMAYMYWEKNTPNW